MSNMNMMNRNYSASNGCGCQSQQPCQSVQPRQSQQPCQNQQPRQSQQPCQSVQPRQSQQPCQNVQPCQSQQPCTCQQPANFDAMNQAQLLNYIDEVSFAAYDALLFLDTHTCDGDALAYCKEMISLREGAKAAYVRRFGPLTADCTNDCECGRWEWVMQPWPWESMQKGGCR